MSVRQIHRRFAGFGLATEDGQAIADGQVAIAGQIKQMTQQIKAIAAATASDRATIQQISDSIAKTLAVPAGGTSPSDPSSGPGSVQTTPADPVPTSTSTSTPAKSSTLTPVSGSTFTKISLGLTAAGLLLKFLR